MSLAARLDRLRDAAGSDRGGDTARRLAQLRGPRANGRGRPLDIAGLAQRLNMERLDDALLVRTREYRLPDDAWADADMTGLPEVCALDDPDWVYVDTETTGLSGGVGNLAFMIGVARLQDERTLVLRQYLLGSFAAESSMLQAFSDWVGDQAVLVSYNGKCFDLPLLIARARMQRIRHALATLPHLDLMYGVRRAFRRAWPDCRLQTAERSLLGVRRVDDKPGAEAPAAWQAWLHGGAHRGLAGVLRHNRQDVVSLALLHRCLSAVYAGSVLHDVDIATIGRAWCEAGREQQARRLWERAGERLDAAGRLQLAALYRRAGEWSRAEAVWLALSRGGNRAAALELSKYYEHRARDYPRAMDYADLCDTVERDARSARLARKIGVNLPLPLAGTPREDAG